MRADAFEAEMRKGEYFHGLTVPSGMWAIVRADGRAFHTLTAHEDFEKPFDPEFSRCMREATKALMAEFGGVYGYTESDEISVVLRPRFDLFGRSVEKLVSTAAAVTSVAFTHSLGLVGTFDARVWIGSSLDSVLDYARWRQADAQRNAVNAWVYWAQRGAGESPQEADKTLHDMTSTTKIRMLNQIPLWQSRGIAIYWGINVKKATNPRTGAATSSVRRVLAENAALPEKAAYSEFVQGILMQS